MPECQGEDTATASAGRYIGEGHDDQVELLRPLAPVDRAEIGRLIDGIFAGGSTNLSGGWLKGTEALRGAKGTARGRSFQHPADFG